MDSTSGDSINNVFVDVTDITMNNILQVQAGVCNHVNSNTEFPNIQFNVLSFSQLREAVDQMKINHTRDYYDLDAKIVNTIKNLIIVPLTK